MFVFGTAEDVYDMGVRIEENGHAFYSGAAEKTEDPNMKKMLEDLAAMELGHVSAFKKLRAAAAGAFPADAVWDPEGIARSYLQAAADTHVFTVRTAEDRLKEINTPMEVLDMALQFEKDSVVFFVSMKESLPDASGTGEVDKLINAELSHIQMINDAQKLVAEGKPVRIS
jgi:rubrerythrin